MNPNNLDDPYQKILFEGYTDQEIVEIQTLMQKWDKATYPTLANSIVDHAPQTRLQRELFKISEKGSQF